jgi:alcohol dehydrogenase (NADP+)
VSLQLRHRYSLDSYRKELPEYSTRCGAGSGPSVAVVGAIASQSLDGGIESALAGGSPGPLRFGHRPHPRPALNPASYTGVDMVSVAVDPALIPQHLLSTGARMPAIGLGTFGSDHVGAEEVACAVRGAAEVGYRHFDCAAIYRNEDRIGFALRDILAGGVQRDELWITSKLWNDSHTPEAVIPTCRKTLADLQLDYLDLYLVHWPFPNHHPPGCDVTMRSSASKPYIHPNYMATWREMERLVDLGLVRHIGTSNMTIPKLALLLADARIRPAVNQMELHPHFQQPELFRFVVEREIHPVGYSPIGSPGRPERDRTPEDTAPTEDPAIVRIAKRLGLHPAVVCIKWGIQRGQSVIPFSTNPRNYLANLRGAVGPPLSGEDMRAIAAIDRHCRLIKGQVFLWETAQGWEDLWDLNGVIAAG